MGELGFVHEYCTFYLNIYYTITPELTKISKEFERNLKNID